MRRVDHATNPSCSVNLFREIYPEFNGNNPQIDLTPVTADSFAAVIVIEIGKGFNIYNAPEIQADYDIFLDTVKFKISSDIPGTGVSQFLLTGDDGSLFRIDEKILSNDGLHGMETRKIIAALEKGWHPVEIQFFEAGGEDGLMVEWKTGSQSLTEIPTENWRN